MRSWTSGALVALVVGAFTGAVSSISFDGVLVVILIFLAVVTAVRSITDKSLLIFLTASTLAVHQTFIPPLRALTEYVRWFPLGLFGLIVVADFSTLHRERRSFSGFDLWILGWIAFAAFSALYSLSPSLTVARSGTVLLMYATVFWGIWTYIDRTSEEKVVGILLMAIALVYALGLSLIPTGADVFQTDGRYRGLLENPNSLGLLTSLCFPLVLYSALRERKLSHYVLISLMVVSLVLSESRTGIMATIVGGCYVLLRSTKKKTLLILIAFVLLWGIGTLGLDVLSSPWLESALFRTTSLATVGGRAEAWPIAITIMLEQPLRGHGFGTEEVLFSQFAPLFREFQGGYVHNSYLGMAIQLGIVGSLLFFGPLCLLALRSILYRQDDQNINLTHALTATLVAGLVASLFESWVYSMGNAQSFFFWVTVMMLLRRTRRREPAYSFDLRRFQRVPSSHSY